MANVFFWIGIGILGLILILLVVMQLPSTKGWAGERIVRGVLKSLPGDKYLVLNDVKFYGREKENAGRGRYKGKRWSCQIDHLVISPYGIFCLETKNFLGTITGNYKDKYLQRRVLGMRYKTYSPIHQNYRHLQRLVETFPLIKNNSKQLHSIVCFIPPGKPKIYGKGAATICRAQNLKKEILKYETPVIEWEVCQRIEKAVRKESRNHK